MDSKQSDLDNLFGESKEKDESDNQNYLQDDFVKELNRSSKDFSVRQSDTQSFGSLPSFPQQSFSGQPQTGRPTPYSLLLKSTSEVDLFSFVQKGAVFWKAGKIGYPHFLLFRVDKACETLCWYSRNKSAGRTVLSLAGLNHYQEGRNFRFNNYCNDRLQRRAVSLGLADISGVLTASSKPVETVDFIVMTSPQFVLWNAFFHTLLDFHKKQRELVASVLQRGQGKVFKEHSSASLQLGRTLKKVTVQINLPPELANKCFLMHRFDFFVLMLKNDTAPKGFVDAKSRVELKTLLTKVEHCLQKCRTRLDRKISIPEGDRVDLSERLELIGADLHQLKSAQFELEFFRMKKVYWLMWAELIAINEALISYTVTNKEQSKFKLV